MAGAELRTGGAREGAGEPGWSPSQGMLRQRPSSGPPKRGKGGSDAQQGQGIAPVGGEETQRPGDVLPPGEAQTADAEVARAGHGLRSSTCAYLRAIFVVDHVPDPVQLIFDAPLATRQLADPGGVCPLRRAAGYPKDDLMPSLLALHHGHRAFDPEYLVNVRAVDVVVEDSAGLDYSLLNSAVGLLHLDRRRGKKSPGPAPAAPPPSQAGCPWR